MDVRRDRHEIPLLQGESPLPHGLIGAALIVIGVAIPFVALYVLWGWLGVKYGAHVAVSLVMGVACVLTGLRLWLMQ